MRRCGRVLFAGGVSRRVRSRRSGGDGESEVRAHGAGQVRHP